MSKTVAVEFSGVSKRFGTLSALDGVNFAIRTGEVVALLGPNGAGKSTSVSLMLGLRKPDAGTVRILGGQASEAVQAGRIGAMLQSSGLPPGLKASELVDFVRGLYPRPTPLRDLLESSGCSEFADRPVERLSSGQVQRLRFAMAIAGNPELLFLDEPTTGFDVDTRRRFWASIRAFAGTGRTVLFATHYLEEADAIADRILVMRSGHIVADGSAASIKGGAGGAVVTFHCESPDPSRLGALDGVTQVDIQGNLVRLITADSDATVRAAILGGLPFRGLEIGGADLEDAFLALVNAKEGGAG